MFLLCKEAQGKVFPDGQPLRFLTHEHAHMQGLLVGQGEGWLGASQPGKRLSLA